MHKAIKCDFRENAAKSFENRSIGVAAIILFSQNSSITPR